MPPLSACSKRKGEAGGWEGPAAPAARRAPVAAGPAAADGQTRAAGTGNDSPPDPCPKSVDVTG